MSEAASPDRSPPSVSEHAAPAPAARSDVENDVPPRYGANLELILRRLADEQRAPKPKRWWKG
jgi:hypothetical protein